MSPATLSSVPIPARSLVPERFRAVAPSAPPVTPHVTAPDGLSRTVRLGSFRASYAFVAPRVAFAATTIVEALIVIAPAATGRSIPHGTSTPAAIVIATTL